MSMEGWKPKMVEDLEWFQLDRYPEVKFTVLSGSFGSREVVTMRVKLPPNYQLAPHTHTDARQLTVIEGTYSLGMGEKFDLESAVQLTAGSFMVVPANRAHFDAAGPDGATIQVTAMGDASTHFLDSSQEPRALQSRGVLGIEGSRL
jgi:quercetin dioxygenase-like cupin family protein